MSALSSLSLLIIRTLAVFGLLIATPALAQMSLLTGSEKTVEQSGLERLMEEARKDGSTVIVVKPGVEGETAKPAMRDMRAADFLRVREKVKKAFESAPSLWPNIKALLLKVSPRGGYVWVFFSLGVVAVGWGIAWIITRPFTRWTRKTFSHMWSENPETTADKAKYLLGRALYAVVLAGIFFLIMLAVAIALLQESEAAKRLVFESIVAFSIYRVLRYGVSWNLIADDAPEHRLLNLNDDEAKKMHRTWWVSVIIGVAVNLVVRFLTLTEETVQTAILTPENIMLLKIIGAAVIILLLVLMTIRNWRANQHAFTPRDETASFYKLRSRLARAAPVIVLLYCGFAFVTFVFKLALGDVDAGAVIGAPFGISYVALVIYGLVLIGIQAYYNRRIRRFEALASAERENKEEELKIVDLEDGEEMILKSSRDIFEYQPIFRNFFENATLAVVLTVSLGELGRAWGVPVGAKGNIWASFLDIILASVLCWIAYSAVRTFVDYKMRDEVGSPEVAEVGGEGGGAGSTRAATLLPIMRYVMLTVLFSITGMIVLSKLGVDIAPIFAGAGVIGIAVGFGAQTLIRDIFSGAFFLMDDAFRKGEYLEIEGIRGTVEKISVRSFQLRHHLGGLHTIPFGEIKQLTNYSRDWVLMKLPLRVTYDTDVEKVRKLVKKLGQELLEHPQVGYTFMQPLKSQGVYKMEDSAMIIRVKFMTKPGEQFVTRKVVYESIQDLFAREGIHFAHKEVTVRLADAQVDNLSKEEKEVVGAAAARSVLDAEEEAALAAAGGKKGGGDR
ncbi:MAG: mechanosensitive ion channel domain-containing protein [Rhizobiaceae bacterium]